MTWCLQNDVTHGGEVINDVFMWSFYKIMIYNGTCGDDMDLIKLLWQWLQIIVILIFFLFENICIIYTEWKSAIFHSNLKKKKSRKIKQRQR